MKEVQEGLVGVSVTESKISYIDGEKGILEYRGYKIKDLVKLPYEAVSYLLIYGKLPNEKELKVYTDILRKNRDIDEGTIEVIRTCNFNIEAMDAMRTGVSYLSHCDLDLNNNSEIANQGKAGILISKIPTIIAYFFKIVNLDDPIPPDKTLSHGSNFLYMLRGTKPTDLEAKTMETDFILSAEHELNASTFAARVTASTQSDLYSAVISGLGTLKGAIHGGARMAVMNMLDEVESPEKAEEYIMNLIKERKKIMGFGHRVYKTYDPRSDVFKEYAKKLADEKNDIKWYSMAENMEKTIIRELVEKKGKPIYPNVDFYAAVVYKYLDLDPHLATSIFAIGRISGWIAHCIEQYATNKLIRPRAVYIGEHGLKP